MITAQLINYIIDQKKLNIDDDSIKTALVNNGWERSVVNEALVKVIYFDSNSLTPKLASPLTLLSWSWKIYKQRLATFLGLVAVSQIVYLIAISLLFLSLILLSVIRSGEKSFLMTFNFITLVIIAVVIIFLIQHLLQIALITAVKLRKDNLSIATVYLKNKNKTFSFICVNLLYILITIGGINFFIIPGIIFTVWFSFAGFIIINEEIGGMSALLKSREYVRGMWLPVFGRLLFSGLFILISFFLISYLPLVIQFIFDPGTIINNVKLSPSFLFDTSTGFSYLLSLLLSYITNPLITIYDYLLYENIQVVRGDFSFKPTKSSKLILLFFGFYWLILIPLSFGVLIYFLINPHAAKL